MNVKLFIGWVMLTLLFFSCEQKKEVSYKKYYSLDKSYSVEIPSNAVQERPIVDFMSFEDSKSRLIITVKRIKEKSIEGYIQNKDITNNTFSYNLFQSSDTTHFYKITRGNNMWSAYDLFMLKRMDGKIYLIEVTSDVIGRSEMIEMIKHIYSSMQSNRIEKASAASDSEEKKTISLEKTYSTRFYSIKYPKGWQKQEHLDEMTDVYIGSLQEDFGFTIVRFETDYTLTEANAEGNTNIQEAGFRILDEKQMSVDGAKCYRAIQEISLQDQKIKHISYTFKKNNVLYNVKFGNVTSNTQEKLAAKIMESFLFKETKI